MKKIFYVLSITFLILQSCSSDDSSGDSSESSNQTTLLKKIVFSGQSINFTYQGNKLTKIVYPQGNYSYYLITYTGDLITRTEGFNNNNQPMNHDVFIYSNNLLTQQKVYSNPNTLEKTYTFTYNSNNSITKNTANSSILYNLDNVGNIIERKEYYNNSLQNTYTYIYDQKNNPFKNVIGYNPLIFGPNLVLWSMSTNNVISQAGSSGFSNNFQYNNQLYPTSVTSTSSGQTTQANYYY
jgi:hypothetical protein